MVINNILYNNRAILFFKRPIISLSTIIVSNLLKTALKVVVKKRIKNFVSNKILLYRHRYSNSKLISHYLTTIFDVSSQLFFYL